MKITTSEMKSSINQPFIYKEIKLLNLTILLKFYPQEVVSMGRLYSF